MVKFLKIAAIVFLILVATVAGAALRILEEFPFPPHPIPSNEGGRNEETGPEEISGDVESSAAVLPIDSVLGKVNVLIIGLDEVDGGRRSDAIAFAVFDQDAQSIRILSIPRDSRVYIPGRGWDKINHAYVYGGLDLLRETVMNLLNMGVDYFVVVNYGSFERIIDLMGGVDINVEKTMRYTDYSGKLFINIPKGQQHMRGKTALEYVRFRHDPLGDIGRVQRQQQFITVVMDKLKSPSIIPNISGLIAEAVSAINTNLTPRSAINLLVFANSLPRERIKLFMAPGKAAYIDNVSYWIINTVDLPKLLTEEDADVSVLALEASMEEAPSSELTGETLLDLVGQIGKIGILNGDGSNGLGKRAAQVFQNLGVDVVFTGNAKHFDYRSSNVIYPENTTGNGRQAAEALAQLCGITNKALIQRDRNASMVSVVLGHDKETIFKRLERAQF
jgi:LCP family protein required for cell wall assembly